MQAYLMPWEEKESGWGIRPDGWSLHASPADYEAFLKLYWATMERYWATESRPDPFEYSRPLDVPLREVEIDDVHPLARRLRSEGSLRINHFEAERYEIERLTKVKWPGT